MSTKLTPAQVNAGWIEIESEEQLWPLENGHYDLLINNGESILAFRFDEEWFLTGGAINDHSLAMHFIAYRPVPSYEEHVKLKKKCESCTRMIGAWQHKTLRDEIAIAAMPAISIHSSPATIEKTARRAYDLADAMLEAREKGDTNAE